MSSRDTSARPSTPSKLDQAIQSAFETFKLIFQPGCDDNRIRSNLNFAYSTVRTVIRNEGGPNLKERLKGWDEFISYVHSGSKEERNLIDLLRSMANGHLPWRELFENEAFLNPEPERKTKRAEDRGNATKLAWDSEFKGDLARVLFDTIADYLSEDRTPYARLTTIVNSSGTGKSRMVDQLSTNIIMVPMCLRRKRGGFPPSDEDLRNWLASRRGNSGSVRKMLHGFTYSLLTATRKRLEIIAEKQKIHKLPLNEADVKNLSEEDHHKYLLLLANRQKELASAFREHMTKDQTYDTPNDYRKDFYTEVTYEAEKFVDRGEQGKGCVQEAGEDLCHFIDEHRLSDSMKGPRRPLVVLAFDEADILTDNPLGQENWNLFSELCRVLRDIQHLQIFSLFLSTGGRFDKFSPNPSAHSLDPITEISFDDIAYSALKDTVAIHDVVGYDWISHLGRPLFGSYLDKLAWHDRCGTEIMDYAKQKLLCSSLLDEPLSRTGSLACLSTRFALEFNMDERARGLTHTLVERHMRLRIAATAGLEKMITISGSEPLLAEAAYELMKNTKPVCHLAMHPDLNCIDRGRRGELVAVLLIMQAYDAARELSRERWVSVDNFMKALLPLMKYDTLLQSAPTSWPIDYPGEKTFQATFQDYRMWFNHVIKIEKTEMISIDHLWKFVVRGAMILCATNQRGIDIVLPVCHKEQNLGPDSVTAIIVQVKNDVAFDAKLDKGLFDNMESVVKSTMFRRLPEPGVDCDPVSMTKKRKVDKVKVVDPKPIIQIVFALASPEPAVVFRDRPEKRQEFDGLTTFDIWLAGLSDETYKQIEDEDLVHYRTLLERSLTPHDAFELTDIGKEAKKSREARRRKMVPLAFPEHASILFGGQPSVAIQPVTLDPQSSTRSTTTASPSTFPSARSVNKGKRKQSDVTS